jgi:hypothetical protein
MVWLKVPPSIRCAALADFRISLPAWVRLRKTNAAPANAHTDREGVTFDSTKSLYLVVSFKCPFSSFAETGEYRAVEGCHWIPAFEKSWRSAGSQLGAFNPVAVASIS